MITSCTESKYYREALPVPRQNSIVCHFTLSWKIPSTQFFYFASLHAKDKTLEKSVLHWLKPCIKKLDFGFFRVNPKASNRTNRQSSSAVEWENIAPRFAGRGKLAQECHVGWLLGDSIWCLYTGATYHTLFFFSFVLWAVRSGSGRYRKRRCVSSIPTSWRRCKNFISVITALILADIPWKCSLQIPSRAAVVAQIQPCQRPQFISQPFSPPGATFAK